MGTECEERQGYVPDCQCQRLFIEVLTWAYIFSKLTGQVSSLFYVCALRGSLMGVTFPIASVEFNFLSTIVLQFDEIIFLSFIPILKMSVVLLQFRSSANLTCILGIATFCLMMDISHVEHHHLLVNLHL